LQLNIGMQMKSYVHNVSFIVIALNEEFAIQKCLESILKLDTKNCELICIDSNSNDNTLDIMKKYAKIIPCTSIFKVNGDRNASIARNIGINNSTKDYIFFIDGDVEISAGFLVTALNKIKNYGAISGNLQDIEYDINYQRIFKTRYRYTRSSEAIINHTGGIFLTKRSVINKIGLFDENLVINEDVDLSLRIGKVEPVLYIPFSMGKHHTVPSTDPKRFYQRIQNQFGLYTGILLKKHLLNKRIIFFIKTQSDLYFGIPFICLIIFCSFSLKTIPYAFAFPFLIFISDIAYGFYHKKNLKCRIFIHYFNPFFILRGFGGLFLKNQIKYSAERVNFK